MISTKKSTEQLERGLGTQCLNGCGELVKLEKPAWVLIDLDVMDYLPEDVKKKVTVCKLIHAICPKCGYNINQELNLEQWQKFIKEHK